MAYEAYLDFICITYDFCSNFLKKVCNISCMKSIRTLNEMHTEYIYEIDMKYVSNTYKFRIN